MPHSTLDAARRRHERIIRFLQDLVRIPSPSTREGPVVARIAEEMKAVGFDEVRIDGLGNVIGRIGRGRHVVAMDAHVDTVAADEAAAWSVPPFSGELRGGKVIGRGAVDQKAGMAALVHAGGLVKELGLEDDFTLLVTGTVQEEDCDGLCWRYLVKEEGLRPDCVVLTEPTNMRLHVGHRGRAEISVRTLGQAAHASAPHRGVNAVYRMGRVVGQIEQLNERLRQAPPLGKGSVAVTGISCDSPSLCSVPGACTINLDRRLTLGDSRQSVLDEVRDAVGRAGEQAEVFIADYDAPSHRGLRYRAERYFPAWQLERTDPVLAAGERVFTQVFGCKPALGMWTFSTNGVATASLGIPTIGLGPGDERLAHAVDECVPADDVVEAAAWYAEFPRGYVLERARPGTAA